MTTTADPPREGTVNVAIQDIVVGKRHRAVADISDIRESIARSGLIHPITVTTAGRLVQGANRLQACRELGWTRIPATVRDLSDAEAELIEIDENLTQHALTVLEQGKHFARRAELVRQMRLTPTANLGAVPPTVAEVVDEAGVSRRTFYNRVALADRIPDAVAAVVAPTAVANSLKDLTELAELPEAEQAAVSQALASDAGLRTVRAARRRLWPEQFKAKDEDGSWDDSEAVERRDVVRVHLTVGLSVRSNQLRARGDQIARREEQTVEHHLQVTAPGSVRADMEGLRGLAGDVARALWADTALREDWLKVPGGAEAP